MTYAAKILADSLCVLNDKQHRLTTFEVTIPRIVLSEFNTHRVFSRNSASSRAIPIEKRISAVEQNPFIPESFGKNRSGMAASESLLGEDAFTAKQAWLDACASAIEHARKLAKLGIHKQLANRLIEPFCWQTIIATATELDNFFALRINPAAQPEIQIPAKLMQEAYKSSTPKLLVGHEWHLPLLQEDERVVGRFNKIAKNDLSISEAKDACVGRCARISYLTHDGKRDYNADIELSKKLLSDGHMSPFEHVARPMNDFDILFFQLNRRNPFLGNFKGWVQYRKEIKNEDNFAIASIQRNK